jgi:glucose/arabinose dehydrogenase
VRARLWWTRWAPADPSQLAADQSPNADLTLSRLEWSGDEAFLREHPGGLVARLDAVVRRAEAGPVDFRMQAGGAAVLEVDGKKVLSSGPGDRWVEGRVALAAGPVRVTVHLALGRNGRHFRLRWDPEGGRGFRPIGPDRLSCRRFHFRPTQPGLKRLREGRDRPGLRMKVAGLHPTLEVVTLHPADQAPPVGGLALLPDGRLAVAEFDARKLRAPEPQAEPDGRLWLYENPAGDPAEVERRLIADDLYEPAGLCAVGGVLYLGQRAVVSRFEEQADGSWRGTPVARGWETRDFHALSFGMVHRPGPQGHPGHLYLGRGTGLGTFRNPPDHGAVWEIDLARPPDRSWRSISGGHRTPNGLALGPGGALFVTDNQGEWTPCNELNHVVEGGFYGFYHTLGEGHFPTPYQPADSATGPVVEAAVWLPQDEIANSPTEPVLIPEGWPFAGQMLVPDMKYGGLNRVGLQRVGGVWQGAAFRFTQGLGSGIHRVVFGPDGSLYLGGIGGDHASTWNWVHPDGHRTYGGLQRLRPGPGRVLDLERVTAIPGGFRIGFTGPVGGDWLAEPGALAVRQWTYRATPDYGGRKVDEEELEIVAAELAPDRRSLRLQVDGLKRDRVVRLTVDARDPDGARIWSAESWVTLRELP